MKRNELFSQYPEFVVIGGVGGSGTRLIAQCLKQAGFHIGTDLNQANDNLWFTLLFKRIEILASSEEEFDDLLQILINRMTGATALTNNQENIIDRLSSEDREQHPASWLMQRAKTLRTITNIDPTVEKWGWKEPNSHIVIDRIIGRLENTKYIHVMRNGLDMAHSTNQNQLKLWGSHFINSKFDINPKFSLRYWCIVHKRILKLKEIMGEKLLLLNYDAFCTKPEDGLEKLLAFLGENADALRPRLIELVKPPSSMGRFKSFGTDMFIKEDVDFVHSLGFDVSS